VDFDELIDRRGTNCDKWDNMETVLGVSPDDGLAMWVADSDFRPPRGVAAAVQAMVDHGIFGYSGSKASYKNSICWWQAERHGWQIDPSWIFTTHGLVNAVGIAIDTYTQPGDGVVIFTPVYHAFARVIEASDRRLVECPLVNSNNRYEMDFDAYDAQMTGQERMVILCSPHNPGGRVWTEAELREVADFAERHDLILLSDEVHGDLVFPGVKHRPMALLPDIQERLVTISAPSKTFNTAGAYSGYVIIADENLRARYAKRMRALSISANTFGLVMTEAAYSPEGAEWVDGQVGYLDGNRRVFDDGIAGIPGLSSMPLEATYLSWVDFSGTGMDRSEFTRRVNQDARIAVNLGPSFGTGGENFLRFNIGTQRIRVVEAVDRLREAFKDLQ
jgi:cystathionine beta-lyase